MRQELVILVVWLLILFGLLLAPIGDVERIEIGGFRHLDKVGHMVLFGITGFLCASSAARFRTLAARIVFGMIFALLLALITEGSQHFVGRTSSFCDLLADMAGLSVGVLAYVLLELRRGRSAM